MVTSRVLFTAAQKAELWERWKNGQAAATKIPKTHTCADAIDDVNKKIAPDIAAMAALFISLPPTLKRQYRP